MTGTWPLWCALAQRKRSDIAISPSWCLAPRGRTRTSDQLINSFHRVVSLATRCLHILIYGSTESVECAVVCVNMARLRRVRGCVRQSACPFDIRRILGITRKFGSDCLLGRCMHLSGYRLPCFGLCQDRLLDQLGRCIDCADFLVRAAHTSAA